MNCIQDGHGPALVRLSGDRTDSEASSLVLPINFKCCYAEAILPSVVCPDRATNTQNGLDGDPTTVSKLLDTVDLGMEQGGRCTLRILLGITV